jgi:putative membrane protein
VTPDPKTPGAAPPPRRRPFARLGVALFAGAGLVLALYLIARTGFADVGETFARAGWGIALILVYDVIMLAAAGLAWWAIMRPLWRGSPLLFVKLRWLREAINNLLPVAQVGGEVVGARLLTTYGPPASLAIAGIVADKTIEALGQFVFTLIGFALFLGHSREGQLDSGLGLGILIAAPLLLAFVGLQNSRAFAAFERLLLSLARRMHWSALGQVEGMHAALVAIYRQPPGVGGGFLFHMTAWISGAGQVWLALHLMGFPITFRDALILESLSQAARSAAFLIPGGLGAQEGALLLIGAAIGLPGDYALALSLIKRTGQIVFGIPMLASWPFLKRRQLATE